jgi:phage tail tape-measure protein
MSDADGSRSRLADGGGCTSRHLGLASGRVVSAEAGRKGERDMDDKDAAAAGKITGGVAGAITGARIGSVIPIPIVAPFVGAVVGGVTGTELGRRLGTAVASAGRAFVDTMRGPGADQVAHDVDSPAAHQD